MDAEEIANTEMQKESVGGKRGILSRKSLLFVLRISKCGLTFRSGTRLSGSLDRIRSLAFASVLKIKPRIGMGVVLFIQRIDARTQILKSEPHAGWRLGASPHQMTSPVKCNSYIPFATDVRLELDVSSNVAYHELETAWKNGQAGFSANIKLQTLKITVPTEEMRTSGRSMI